MRPERFSQGNRPMESREPDMNAATLRALEACYRLLEEKRDPALCLRLFPELSDEIRGHLATHQVLFALSPSEPDPLALVSGRRCLRSALSQQRLSRSRPTLSRRLSGATLAGWLVALSMFSAAAVMGASASTPRPMDAVLNGLHIPHNDGDQHVVPTPTDGTSGIPAGVDTPATGR